MKPHTKVRGTMPGQLGGSVLEIATRTRGDGQPSPPPYTWNRGGSWLGGDYEETHGFSIPHFHARKKAGEFLPQTPFRQVQLYATASAITWNATITHPMNYGGGTTTLVGSGTGLLYWPEFLPPASEDTDMLVADAAADLYSSGFDGLTFAAELPSLVRLFRGGFDRLRDMLKEYDARKLGDSYLEVRYGFRPLLNDMNDIAALIRKTLAADAEPTMYTGEAKRVSTSTSMVTVPGLAGNYVEGTWLLETVTSVRARVYSRIKPADVILNVPLTLYEATRLSFVLDWFIAVGKWLEAVSASVVHYDMQAAVGTKITQTATLQSARLTRVSSPSGAISGTSVSATGVHRVVTTIREPATVKPVPPRLQFNLDLLKVLDLLFLTKQMMKTAPKGRRMRTFRYRPRRTSTLPTIKWKTPVRNRT